MTIKTLLILSLITPLCLLCGWLIFNPPFHLFFAYVVGIVAGIGVTGATIEIEKVIKL